MIKTEHRQSPAAPQAEEDELESEIDETLKETFPASDAPSWTLGTDHQVESQSDVAENEE